MNAPKENMLFFSKKCQMCADLFSLLNDKGILCYFKLFCVDNMKNIPSEITHVPTMLIAKVPKPYVANEIMQIIYCDIHID